MIYYYKDGDDMFIDTAKIVVTAGNGGDGAVAWRREKFEPSGGPAGGDGGNGGNVIIKADENINTLMDFRYKRVFKAQNGENGRNKKQYGAKGEDTVLKVPVGTLVKDAETERVIADLKENDQEFIAAKGGIGGKGNAKFKNPIRQAPKFAQPGRKGESFELILELKLLADVGLIGFPNVGKSSFLSVVSAAKPKISNYHFTTLEPNLGVVRLGEGESFVIADIPGLIEGASKGVGLGIEFLKHIERTGVLLHILDISGSEGRDPIDDYYKINAELKDYNEKLSQKPQVIFANKMDLPGASENLKRLEEELKDTEIKIFSGSVVTTKNLEEVLYYLYELTKKNKEKYKTYDIEYVEEKRAESQIKVERVGNDFIVSGEEIDYLIRSINFDDDESTKYFQDILRKKGVIDLLEAQGIKEGDNVFVADIEFEYIK